MRELSTSALVVVLLSLLTGVFVVLKRLDFINWSWWFVLMPILIPLLLFILFASLVICVSFKYKLTDFFRLNALGTAFYTPFDNF